MIPLPPGVLGFFTSYWKIIAVVLLIASAYIKGCSDEKERFDEYKALVTAIGQAQERWAADRARTQKAITLRKDQAYEMDLARLRTDNATLGSKLRNATARTVFVPTVPDSAGGSAQPGLACFEGSELNAGIRGALGRLLTGLSGLFQKCSEAGLAGRTCTAWVLEQWKLSVPPPTGAP